MVRLQPIKVAVRCCPGRERSPSISFDSHCFKLQRPKTTLTKSIGGFDFIVREDETENSVCSPFFSPATRSAVENGEDITLMSFGAMQTGKTSTMRQAMITAKTDVFQALESALKQGDEVMVSMTALISAVTSPVQSHLSGRQVAHEVLLDALLPNGADAAYKGGLHVREHPKTGFFVEGLTEVCVSTEAECLTYLERAMDNFEMEEKRCGSGAGAPLRVHCLLTLRVWRRSRNGEELVSDVQILDLSGWQRATPVKGPLSKGSTATAKGGTPHFEDMVLKSIMRIIDSLEQKMSHVPYRDSKMSRLLCNALGGRGSCYCVMHVSLDTYDETEAMLQLAQKMTTISNKVVSSVVNYDALQQRNGEKIQELCSKLGMKVDNIRSSSMALTMASTNEEVQLRDLVSYCESLANLKGKWENLRERSDKFKFGQGTGDTVFGQVTVERLDRNNKSRPFAHLIEVNTSVSEERDMKASGQTSIANRLALLQMRKGGGSRLRAMS